MHRATDTRGGRDVAIKIATQAGRDGDALQALLRVMHPNLAAPLESGRLDDGRAYMVLPFVQGRTLRQLLAEERPPLALALRWMGEVLDALAALHRVGIVHRDVKPENILITQSGAAARPVLVDFGFAADLASAGAPAGSELLGTPRYAAPEQLRGEEPSARADLYSWALVLLECLGPDGGPRETAAHEAVAKRLGDTAVAIPDLHARTAFGRFLETMVARDPERRPRDAVAAMEQLILVTPELATFTGAAVSLRGNSRRDAVATVLAARLHADDTSEEVTARLFEAGRALRRRGATLLRSCGTTLVAAFLHDDGDAESATTLAIDAATALVALPHAAFPLMSWSAAVDCGALCFAHGVTEDGNRELVIGSAIDRACAMAGRTPAGRVDASEAARESTGDRLLWAAVTALDLQDAGGELQLFRLRGPARRAGRRGSPPLQGRHAEQARIRAAWEQARSGRPQTLLLHGAPGIGKSALLRSARELDPQWVEAACSAERADVPFGAVVELLRALDMPAPALALRFGLDPQRSVALLAMLLDESPPAGFTLPLVTPERLRDLATAVVIELLLALATEAPTLLVLEDLQWADASTLALVERLLAILASRDPAAPFPLLLLLSSRDAFAGGWQARGVERIEIGPMPAEDGEALLRASQPHADDAFVRELLRVSRGLPLFLEQAKPLAGDVATAAKDAPRSLAEVLDRKIAALDPEIRAFAQAAAALGREFDGAVAGSVTQLSGSARLRALEALRASGLLEKDTPRPTFTHALVRDAVHASLDEDQRADLHLRLARALERRAGQQHPAELARHYELAGEMDAAAQLWHRAGVLAAGAAAYPEALRCLQRARALLEGLPATAERAMRRFGVVSAIVSVQISTRGWGAVETRTSVLDARRLCDAVGRKAPLELLGAIFGTALVTADNDGVAAILPRFRELAARGENPLELLAGEQVLGVHACWSARFQEARKHAGAAVELYRREALHEIVWEVGFGFHSYAYLAMAQFHCGDAVQAEATRVEMMRHLERSGNPYFIAVGLGWSATLTHDCGRDEETLELASRLAHIAEDQQLPLWQGYAMLSRGSALTALGDLDEALDCIRRGLAVMDALGVVCGRAYYDAYLVRALVAAGRPAEAIVAAHEGIALCRRVWTRLHESELLRLHGVALERVGRHEDARRVLGHALGTARRDGSPAIALRALCDLLEITEGKDEAIAAELEAAVTAMSGGARGTRDLRHAERLLGGPASPRDPLAN